MFKTLKYLFLVGLYKKAKKSLMMLGVYLLSLILFTFLISDILSISTGAFVYLVLIVKWIGIITLLGLIVFSTLKIFNIALKPLDSQEEEGVKDEKKEKILSKEILHTQSDLILQKYMKD
ncbi:MAG: hypothetical protein U9N33_05655 [Campylobacterota bacterium]|nr:hypothetical protein [Campylobacterota bacterium]